MHTRRTALALAAAGAVVAAGGAGLITYEFMAARRNAARRLAATPPRYIRTRSGLLEYAEAGQGPPVLMIHGSGGGYDQGLLFAADLIARGWRVIAPSRFGYLGSDLPKDASSEAQADVFAELLDALEIRKAAVIGGSAGALSALQTAIRHPPRCAALVALAPAAYAPDRPSPRPWSPVQARLAQAVLNSDLLFWMASRAFEDQLMRTLMATDPELVRRAAPAERTRARSVLQGVFPVERRAAGLGVDGGLAGNPAPMALGGIACPTLALACADDLYQTLPAARHIAASVPGARLVEYPTGGHLWVGRQRQVTDEIDRFLRAAPAWT